MLNESGITCEADTTSHKPCCVDAGGCPKKWWLGILYEFGHDEELLLMAEILLQ